MNFVDRRAALRIEAAQMARPESIAPNPFEVRGHHLRILAHIVGGVCHMYLQRK